MNIITEATNTVSEKKYKCPYCETRVSRKEMCYHIEKKHDDFIPQDMTAMQVAFNTVNKKKENYGYCIMCHSHTKWNEDKARYDRLCGSKKCHDEYVKLCADRLKKAKGITKQEMLSDPSFQDKMLEGRSISGTYKFTDGGTVRYVGSYEKNFLEFMDKVMKIKSEDIEGPGPIIKYMYRRKKHFWITDFLYKPYNIVFDIKDGGSNPNNREMEEYREKQTAKEKAISKLGLYNYCRLTDNDFSQLLEIMLELKETLMDIDDSENQKSYKPIIKINEDAIYSAINRYPVYIVLMHSGTGMSNVIKAVTRDEFSHACISFDPTMETMYSFGGKSLGSLDLGLTSMGKSNAFFEKFKAHYAVYCMYLNKEQFDRMKERLQYFIDREPKLKYDFPSLIACALKIPTEFRKKYFCSRFVMDVIGAGIHIDKAPSLWTPQDITLLNNITKVNGGEDFRKYDPKVTKKNMNMIKKNRYDKIKIAEAVNESANEYTDLLYTKILETVLSEWGTGFNALPAVTQKPIYIVNRMQNNVFGDDDYDDIMELDSIFESSLISNIDKDYKPKGKKNLSSFKKIKATKQIIDQYKKQYSFLRHIDYNDNVYLWIDNNSSIVGVASVDNRDDYNWITAIEITKAYQGYGLGKAILDYSVKQMHGNALTVNKKNKIAQKMYLDYGFKLDKKDKKDSQVYYMYLNKPVSEFFGIGYGDDYSLSRITVFRDDDDLNNETISQKIKEGEINVFKYIGSPETIVENMYYSICNNSFDHDNYVKVYPEVCSKMDAIREVTEYTMKADIARLNETAIQSLSESFNLQMPQYENANFDCKQDINGVYIQNKLTTMRSKSRESFDQIPTEVKKLVNIGYI